MESSEKKRPIKTLGVIFLGLLLSLLVFRVVKDGIFAKNAGINLLVVGESDMAVLVLRPDEDITSWINLPSNLKVPIYNSPAAYPIKGLWAYGVSERRPFEIAEKSIGQSMKVVIARGIKIRGNVSIEAVLANLHKINLQTDLSLRDRFLIRQYLAESATSKKILEMDIPSNTLDKFEEPDGKQFVVFNDVISLWSKNRFLLESILNENAEVSVNNLSGIPGFGTEISKQLESAGVRVVEVKTDPVDISGSGCIFASWGEFPNTENFLKHQLGCIEKNASDKSGEMRGIDVWLK